MAAITANTSALGSDIIGSAANSLGSGTYCVSSAVDLSAVDPLDVLVQVEVTQGASSSGTYRQVSVFVKPSLDGTNFGTGPESGTDSTNEAQLEFIGSVPTASANGLSRRVLSLAAALGYIPTHFKIVLKNENGAALAASGHSVKVATQAGVST